MEKKIKVAIVFGGRSTEHEISLLSARNVFKSLDTEKYEAVLIGIDKNGQWHHNENSMSLLNAEDAEKISLSKNNNPILLSQNTDQCSLISLSTKEVITKIDVIFPVLHGTYGEDGSIQGFAKIANIPCVGCGILGSAIGMDKDIMKRILRDSGIPVAKWVTIKNDHTQANYNLIEAELGNQLFIKPANLGSSVGVSFTTNESEFYKALEEGLQYDSKVIVEEKIVGREIECAVLGNEHPKASIAGEVVPKNNFYSYESKYLDESGAELHIPADLTALQLKAVQELSLETYSLLECAGMTRVDMFLKDDDSLIINEINTIPGFTNISMYPKLWEKSGVPQQELISTLIELALDAQVKQNNLLLK